VRAQARLGVLLFLAIACVSSTARAQILGTVETLPTARELLQSGPISDEVIEAEMMEEMRRPLRTWYRAEFLVGYIKTANLPPLVTQGPFTDARPGSLDSLETKVLFGQGGMDFQDRTGGRFTVGCWLDDEQIWGVHASYFLLRGRAVSAAFSSQGEPVLAVPFVNANTLMQDSSLVTLPGILNGQIVVDAPSFLTGAEANVTAGLWVENQIRWEALAGFRYLNLQESLNIHAVSRVELAPQYVGFGIPFDGNTITVQDSFETRNNFYGGQLGGRFEWNRKRWTLDMLAKIAFGVTHEIVKIRGNTSIDTDPPIHENGGLFAVATNSGRFTKSSFAVVPEVGMTLKFQLTERLQLFGGYTFLYWSRVARPADQIDPVVNPNFVPTSTTFGAAGGVNRPALQFRQTDFIAHFAHFGLEFRY